MNNKSYNTSKKRTITRKTKWRRTWSDLQAHKTARKSDDSMTSKGRVRKWVCKIVAYQQEKKIYI